MLINANSTCFSQCRRFSRRLLVPILCVLLASCIGSGDNNSDPLGSTLAGNTAGSALPTEEVAAPPEASIPVSVVSPGSLHRLQAGDDLQQALDMAEPGDTIELEAGAVFRGPFSLPSKVVQENTPELWITIRSSLAESQLPAGQRVGPGDVSAMAVLETEQGAVVTAAAGAHHYRFIGVSFRPAVSATSALNTLVLLDGEEPPHHLVFERCYLRGDPARGTRRGIVMNSAYTAVLDSYFADFKAKGVDAQALVGWSGTGPFRIENNYLEASGENLMFGGGDPEVAGLVPADIVIRGNHFAKPTAWRNSTEWTVKNLFELKNARRVSVDGNVFEYNWPQAQNGLAILFTVRNQGGKAPWSVVEDISFSNNIVRHIAGGINILGHDDIHPSQQAARIHIRNNLFYDLGGNWGGGDLFQLLDGADSVVIENNTAINEGRIVIAEGRNHSNFVLRNNIVFHRQFGISGTGSAPGVDTLQRYFIDAEVSGNLIVGAKPNDYPPANSFPAKVEELGFVDADNGDYRRIGNAGVDFDELCAALSRTERPDFCENSEE